MEPLQHELETSYQVVNFTRFGVVNLDRSRVVSLNRTGVVNFIGFCKYNRFIPELILLQVITISDLILNYPLASFQIVTVLK